MRNFNQTYRLELQGNSSNRPFRERSDDIDVDRLVWDVEYRELVKRILEPKGRSQVPMGI